MFKFTNNSQHHKYISYLKLYNIELFLYLFYITFLIFLCMSKNVILKYIEQMKNNKDCILNICCHVLFLLSHVHFDFVRLNLRRYIIRCIKCVGLVSNVNDNWLFLSDMLNDLYINEKEMKKSISWYIQCL